MFIAMNRFRVLPGAEGDFEQLWLTRDSQLHTVPGFVEFHLFFFNFREYNEIYTSHTIWRDYASFEAWTTSEAFRRAHAGTGGTKPLYLGHPEFEGFEVLQTVQPAAAA